MSFFQHGSTACSYSNFHNAPLASEKKFSVFVVRKQNVVTTQWKEVFSLRGTQIERGYITVWQMTSHIVMYAWLLTETERWTVRILIRRSYSMDYTVSNWKDASLAFKKYDVLILV